MVVYGLINMVAEIVNDEGHQDNFAWSSILENIYHIYIYTNNINPQNLSFEDFFVSLANALF